MTVAVPRLRHFIGGTWIESRGDRWIHDVNPSDATDVIAHVPEGVADDVAGARPAVASTAASATGASRESMIAMIRAGRLAPTPPIRMVRADPL